MAKRIQRATDLPKWFELERYAGATSLDTVGWYEQLSVRRDLLGMIASPRRDHCQTEEYGKADNSTTRVLALMREMPIVDIAGNELLREYFYGGAMHELKARDPRYTLGVHLATVRELHLAESNIENGKRDYARNFFAQFDRDNDDWKPLTYKCTDWIDEPVDAISTSGFSVNVQVNMSVSDKVLIEQFKQLLRSLRAPAEGAVYGVQNWRKPKFSDWIGFGVLPYLDLRIWEREAGTQIPNRVMADAIFPPGQGGEEVVRKTTSKLADELLNRRNLETLAALAAGEIAEQDRT